MYPHKLISTTALSCVKFVLILMLLLCIVENTPIASSNFAVQSLNSGVYLVETYIQTNSLFNDFIMPYYATKHYQINTNREPEAGPHFICTPHYANLPQFEQL